MAFPTWLSRILVTVTSAILMIALVLGGIWLTRHPIPRDGLMPVWRRWSTGRASSSDVHVATASPNASLVATCTSLLQTRLVFGRIGPCTPTPTTPQLVANLTITRR